MAETHPASEAEVAALRAFEGSGIDVVHAIGDKQDMLATWQLLGVVPGPDHRKVVLIDVPAMAVAWVEGDGAHFGRVVAPAPEQYEEVIEALFAQATAARL